MRLSFQKTFGTKIVILTTDYERTLEMCKRV